MSGRAYVNRDMPRASSSTSIGGAVAGRVRLPARPRGIVRREGLDGPAQFLALAFLAVLCALFFVAVYRGV